MDYEMYKNIIDSLSDYLFEVSLFDQGEPLIDPRIIDFIKYASSRNIGTIVSTNFSFKLSDEKLTQLITSGLDYLQVAIDGVTQEVYEKYRIGGNLELVLKNLKRLIELKRSLNFDTPIIEWQMIDFDFNKHEQEKAKEMANEIGVDRFVLKEDCYSINKSDEYMRKTNCFLLWFSFAVECDGAVSACLTMDDDSLYVGNLKENAITEIWNSESYQALRKNHTINNQYFCKSCNRFDRVLYR